MRTFQLRVHDDRHAEHIGVWIIANDEGRARALATGQLGESPHRLSVEVFERRKLLFCVGRAAGLDR